MISAEKAWPCKHIRTLHCKVDLIYVFPEMSLPRLVYDFHIHVYVSDLYIYSQDRSAYFAAANLVDRSWEYVDHLQIFECRNWE
jgi:hypothetical protein